MELGGGERVVGGVEVIEQEQTVHPLDVHLQMATLVEETSSRQLRWDGVRLEFGRVSG